MVKEALSSYWGKSKNEGNREGHFIRRSENVTSYLVPRTVDSYIKKPAKLAVILEK